MMHAARPDHRVLVVEDELMIAMLFDSILDASSQCTVIGPFARVKLALEAARNEPLHAGSASVSIVTISSEASVAPLDRNESTVLKIKIGTAFALTWSAVIITYRPISYTHCSRVPRAVSVVLMSVGFSHLLRRTWGPDMPIRIGGAV
jgi:hypothetical protein